MLTIRRSIGNGVEEISSGSVPDFLQRRDANLWFHCDAPTDEELRFLKEHVKIHDLTLEDIVHQNQRPKLEPFDDYVYLAVHPLLRQEKGNIEPSELDLLVGEQWLVSAHYGPLPDVIENSRLHDRILGLSAAGQIFFSIRFWI
jgi:magnesium transporter